MVNHWMIRAKYNSPIMKKTWNSFLEILNGDNVLDAIMNANITQWDGGNVCCLCVEYVMALSQSNGKNTIAYFEYPEISVVTVQTPFRIEGKGSIFTKEF